MTIRPGEARGGPARPFQSLEAPLIRKLALLLAFLVPSACGDEPPIDPEPPGPPVTRESAAVRTATIGPRGGSLSATASDGTQYTLEVPAGALISPREITLTPISRIRDLGLSGGLAGAVEMEPSGLSFATPAILRIRTSRSAPAGLRLVGFVGSDDFSRRTLSPALRQGGEVRIPVFHFSQSGAGFGTVEEVRRFPTAVPEALGLDGFLGQLTEMVPGPWDAATQARADSIARRAFFQIVLPGLQGADTDAKLLQAISDYATWRLMLSIVAHGDVNELFTVDNFRLTVPLSFMIAEQLARDRAEPRLRQAVDGNIRVCGEEGSRQAHRNVYFWMEQAARIGISDLAVTGDPAEFIARINRECVTPVLLEHNLPSTLTLGAPFSLDLRFAAEYRNGRRDTTDFSVRLEGSGVTIQNPQGFTGIGDANSPLGFYTTVITPISAGMALRAHARLFDSDRVPPQPDPNPSFTLSEATFELAGGLCLVLASTGASSAAGALPAGGRGLRWRLASAEEEQCEEPEPPDEPEPPTGECPSISTSGMDPDTLNSITCAKSLLVSGPSPVEMQRLTRVEGTLSIRSGAVSFSAPSLATVGNGLFVDSPSLVTLRLPALSRVDNGLVIQGTALSSLGEIGCPTVTNGVNISFNLNLPQAQALAKAQCMTVLSGSVVVEGNKP